MGTVNNSNMTWHELICIVINSSEVVKKSFLDNHGDPEIRTWCSLSPLDYNNTKATKKQNKQK